MKRTSIIFSVVALSCALFLWSCKKDDPNDPNGNNDPTTDTFTLNVKESGALPANAQQIYNFAPVGFKVDPAHSASFPSNVDAELSAKGTTRDKVVSIKGKSLQVNVLSPATQNLDFMDSIWVYVQKYNSNDPRILFATALDYPQGKRSLDLLLEDTDVKEVFNADSVTLILVGTKRAGSHTIATGAEIEFLSEIEGVFQVVP